MPERGIATNQIPILLVEDNTADARLTEEILMETNCEVSVSIIRDGEEAIRTIDSMCETGNVPHLILLDLKLPKIGGLEVLKHIRQVEGCRGVRVAILTGSLLPEDRIRASELRADAYLVKPMSSEEFKEVTAALKSLISAC